MTTHAKFDSPLASMLGRAAVLLLIPLGCADPNGSAGPVEAGTGDSGTAIVLPDMGPMTEKLATLTGHGIAGALDGPRGKSLFDNPVNLAVGPDGTIYVCDFNNRRIRRVSLDGTVSTLINQANFPRPFGIAFTPNGNLYVQTDGNDTGGVAFDNGTIWRGDIAAASASVVVRDIGRPRGLAALTDNTLVIVDNMAHVVRLLDLQTKTITTLAGAINQAGYQDGQGAAARFDTPYASVVLKDGTILVTDEGNRRLRAITLDGKVATWAGNGLSVSKDGSRLDASFNDPRALAIDGQDNVYVTDLEGYVIRKIDSSGYVSTIAGNVTPGFKDGQPLLGELFGLEGLAASRDGQYLFCADGNRGETGPYHRIRRLTLENE